MCIGCPAEWLLCQVFNLMNMGYKPLPRTYGSHSYNMLNTLYVSCTFAFVCACAWILQQMILSYVMCLWMWVVHVNSIIYIATMVDFNFVRVLPYSVHLLDIPPPAAHYGKSGPLVGSHFAPGRSCHPSSYTWLHSCCIHGVPMQLSWYGPRCIYCLWWHPNLLHTDKWVPINTSLTLLQHLYPHHQPHTLGNLLYSAYQHPSSILLYIYTTALAAIVAEPNFFRRKKQILNIKLY